MGSGVSGLYGGAAPLVEEAHLDEMEKKGVKFSIDDIIMTAKDEKGNLVWLEKGDNNKGLQHILYGSDGLIGHEKDFERAFKISKEGIPVFLKSIITNGSIISDRKVKLSNGKIGIERVYNVDGKHFLLTGVGTNGFIVTSYPVEVKLR